MSDEFKKLEETISQLLADKKTDVEADAARILG
jgi:hypothetical protein